MPNTFARICTLCALSYGTKRKKTRASGAEAERSDSRSNRGELREDHLQEHAQLESLFEELMSAIRASDHETVRVFWTHFDAQLIRHMELEEGVLVTALLRRNQRRAHAIMAEHRHFRTRLAELGKKSYARTLATKPTRSTAGQTTTCRARNATP